MRSITRKTVALAEPLRAALSPPEKRDHSRVAKRRDTAANDVDLMVLSNSLTCGDVLRVPVPQNHHPRRARVARQLGFLERCRARRQ